MESTAETTKDASVDDFLARIRELGDRQDKEDEERTRKLEEEILAAKQARQARRAERARSLSPEKDTPPVTPKAVGNRNLHNSPALTPTPRQELLPTREESVNEALLKLSGKSLQADTDSEVPASSSSITDSPAAPSANEGSPTPPVRLSWQRRPANLGRRERPVTMYARRPSIQEEPSQDHAEPSRADIAKSLGVKGLDFFKQTEDRAASVIKKTPEDYDESSNEKRELPGLTASTSPSEQKEQRRYQLTESYVAPSSKTEEALKDLLSPPPPKPLASMSLSSIDAGLGGTRGRAASLLSNSSTNRFLSDVVLNPMDSSTGVETSAMSPSQARLSPERKDRTPSPTKGVGGFVQSAMLKRDGSINKRWSQREAASTISRTTSTVTPRPVSLYGGSFGLDRPSNFSLSRENITLQEEDKSAEVRRDNSSPARSNTVSTPYTRKQSGDLSDSSLPIAPSKTYDTKRWSPTKSSWLESALKKGSEGPTKTPFSPPPGPKPPSPERKPPAFEKSLFTPSETVKAIGVKPAALTASPLLGPPPAFADRRSPSPPSKFERRATMSHTKSFSISEKPLTGEKPSPLVFGRELSASPPKNESPKPAIAPKPTGISGPIDFRSNLRPRQESNATEEKRDLEFLDAMSRLRSAKTQNYVAKDVLKETITQGKDALTKTGGVPPRTRVDPLKESILSAKETLKQKSTDSGPPPTQAITPAAVLASAASKTEPFTRPTLVKPSALKDRMNPNLAALLSRGPPGKPLGGGSGVSIGLGGSGQSSPTKEEDEPKGAKELTHLTKGRARGPKRRNPTSKTSATAKSKPEKAVETPKSQDSEPADLPKAPSDSTPVISSEQTSNPSIGMHLTEVRSSVRTSLKSEKPTPQIQTKPQLATPVRKISVPLPGMAKMESVPTTPVKSAPTTPEKSKPETPPKKPSLTQRVSTDLLRNPSSPISPTHQKSIENIARLVNAGNSTPTKPNPSPKPILPIREPSPSPMVAKKEETSLSVSTPAPKPATATPPKPVPATPPKKETLSSFPVVKKDISLSLKDKPLPIHPPKPSAATADFPTKPGIVIQPSTPPKPSNLSKPLPQSPLSSPPPPKSTKPQPIPHTKPVSLAGALESSRPLSPAFARAASPAPPPSMNISTLKFTVQEINADGKRTPMPTNQEHIFYDECMYVCLHMFQGDGIGGAECFLWTGSKVSPAAVEDVQIFAKGWAKSNDAKLITVPQGAEPPTFLRALGSLFITRLGRPRGNANSFMLCCKCHDASGSMLFSEVVPNRSHLKPACAIIVGNGAKVWIWKGKGCAGQELGAARLVGVDMGEVMEIDEGFEDDHVGFWEVVGR